MSLIFLYSDFPYMKEVQFQPSKIYDGITRMDVQNEEGNLEIYCAPAGAKERRGKKNAAII